MISPSSTARRSVVLEVQAAHGAGPHLVVEDLVGDAAALAAVHRGVGVAQQRLGPCARRTGQRDADARAHARLVAVGDERFVERLHDPLRDGHRLVLADDVLAEHDELVAADPRRGVTGAQDAAQAPRDADQQPVAALVAERVVDAP